MDAAPGKICIVCHREFANDIQECPFDRVRLTEKDSRIGTIFDGKYEILDFVGVGGMSRVYKARHKELNRLIALKILKSSELIDLQRFRREAVSVGQLDHENIARIYSFAVSPQGNPYMAQEFLDGGDLADYIAKTGPLSPDRAVSIFIQVAAALEHAHSRDVIHRDIKPGNIMLLSSSTAGINVKVVDFGMAKLHLESSGDQQRLTQEGEIFGTRQYISPEQYQGKEADARADVYSFGITMYECLLKDGKIPDIFRSFISRATESDPERRIQSAKELREELIQFRESFRETGVFYVDAAESGPAKKDLFGTFYFWSMLVGMVVVGVFAAIVVKQRMTALEVISRPGKKVMTRIAPLSFSATQAQANEFVDTGHLDAAIRLYNEWIKRNENNPDRWQSVCMGSRLLGSVYTRLNRLEEAKTTIEQGFKIAEAHPEGKDKTLIELKCAMAAVVAAQEKFEEAIAVSREAVALCDEPPPSKDKLGLKVLSLYNISRCYLRLGKSDEAERFAEEGIKIVEQSEGVNSAPFGEGKSILVDIYLRRKEYDKALEAAEHTVACFHRYGHSSDSPYLQAVIVRAKVQMQMGKKDEVLANYLYVLAKMEKTPHTHPALENEMRAAMRRIALYLHREDDLPKLKDIPL